MDASALMTGVADVRLVDVTKRFEDVTAVDRLSLEIEHGSFFALLGPSGCGKTTTLRMIGGFEQPTEGQIYLGSTEVSGLPSYKRDVNTVFQSYALFPHLSVFENVAFGLRRQGVRGGRIEQLGTPSELYETPSTAFVAGFLGVSNLIPGTVSGPDSVRLRSGPEVRVRPDALAGRTGEVAVGIRPEKIELGQGQANSLDGTVVEEAYVGVSTQYIVETGCGLLTVYRQNASPGLNGAAPGQRLTLSWSPESTFVVDSLEGSE